MIIFNHRSRIHTDPMQNHQMVISTSFTWFLSFLGATSLIRTFFGICLNGLCRHIHGLFGPPRDPSAGVVKPCFRQLCLVSIDFCIEQVSFTPPTTSQCLHLGHIGCQRTRDSRREERSLLSLAREVSKASQLRCRDVNSI